MFQKFHPPVLSLYRAVFGIDSGVQDASGDRGISGLPTPPPNPSSESAVQCQTLEPADVLLQGLRDHCGGLGLSNDFRNVELHPAAKYALEVSPFSNDLSNTVAIYTDGSHYDDNPEEDARAFTVCSKTHDGASCNGHRKGLTRDTVPEDAQPKRASSTASEIVAVISSLSWLLLASHEKDWHPNVYIGSGSTLTIGIAQGTVVLHELAALADILLGILDRVRA
eukprot:8497202-Pyramimonas_sp.AAC.1